MYAKSNAHITCAALALAFVLPGVGYAATLYLSPAAGTYEVGERILVQALVSGDVSLNAASALITVPPDLLAIESVSKSGSILNFWVTDPSVSRAAGTAQFEGVSLSGFQGSRGLLVTLTLKALAPGSAAVSFSTGQVLANDGQGTDITGSKSGAAFTIVPASVKAPPKPAPAPAKVEPVEELAPEVLVPIVVTPRTTPDILLGVRDGKSAILGTTGSPHTGVLVHFESDAGTLVYVMTETDGLGSFAVHVPASLRSGTYTVTAFSKLTDGSYSDASNVITVGVGTILYGDFTWQSAAYLAAGLALLFALIIAYLLTRRHFGGDITPIQVRKRVRDAERIVQKTFSILRQDIASHARSRKRAGKPEDDVLDIEQDLDDSETAIEEKLKGISDNTKG